ncbi:hypothetical protein C8Q74DRAFT_1440399 [Fomes fomentarius]|nr:hypothetical protein C8Q74DRAFT_1440399 [Fomes fomentarius]
MGPTTFAGVWSRIRTSVRVKTKATYGRPIIRPMRGPATPYLPPEMIDEILSYLVGNCRTLCKCALVCRAWLPFSTRHSHKAMNVRLRDGRRYTRFINEVLHADTPPPWIPSIHTIILDGSRAKNTGIRNFLHDFAGKVAQLQTLELNWIDWTGSSAPHPSVYLVASSFSSLHTLFMWKCHFPSFTAVRRLITPLPHLKTLKMIHVKWPEPSQSLLITASNLPRPAIEHLTLGTASRSMGPLCRWLCATPSRTSLRSLDFKSSLVHREDPCCIHLLFTVAPQLERLELCLEEEDPLSSLLQAYPISQLTALKQLKIRVMSPVPNWITLGNLVQELPCQLNHLVITTRWRSDFTNGLEAFDEILDACQLKLHGIDYVLYEMVEWLESKDAHAQATLQVRSCLPRLCAHDKTQTRVIFGL